MSFSQEQLRLIDQNTKKSKEKIVRDTIGEMRYFTVKLDTVVIDTTITIKKHYKHNLIRRDLFNYSSFSNVGEHYNNLRYNSDFYSIPIIGTNKRIHYWDVGDVRYYDVKLPFTEIFYLEGIEEGQSASGTLSGSSSKKFNIAVTYKGNDSKGDYNFSRCESTNFVASSHYSGDVYGIKTHYAYQIFSNRENGGLTKESRKSEFESGELEYVDNRRLLKTNFTDQSKVETALSGKRFYFEHYLDFLQGEDIDHSLQLKHIFKRNKNHYLYKDVSSKETGPIYMADVINETSTNDSLGIMNQYNSVIVEYKKIKHFSISVGLAHNKTIYGNDSIQTDFLQRQWDIEDEIAKDHNANDQKKDGKKAEKKEDKINVIKAQELKNIFIDKELNTRGTTYISNASFKVHSSIFNLNVNASYNFKGLFKGAFEIDTKVDFPLSKSREIQVGLNIHEQYPQINQMLYFSNYDRFNWSNDFGLISNKNLYINWSDKVLGKLGFKLNKIRNYVYFDLSSEPKKHSHPINIFELEYDGKIEYMQFSLDNRAVYQRVIGSNVIRIPNFIIRNSLYYTGELFDNALKFQTGITHKYFSEYRSNSFNTLLNEFHLQNESKIGNYSVFDIFFNAKVRTMRIFIRIEHIDSFDEKHLGLRIRFNKKYNYYSAPGYPYRDWFIRWGVVWNLFS
ncbi:putative porin [Ichthyobacterium seriolicida]|uniref:TonB-dependent receptor n=1 Tax=Ichthyobacterium seriolicida TaxID=242600 RepID=A0A1J1DYC4_9FLAO|nr:putative porin [Ichthyobacterium seriolicida]BAV94887.1 hypothetical protein JBKA6_0874 [Ichthyobacterium seriolicida]